MVAVHFLSEMKVRRNGVFKKLRQKIASQKQNHRNIKGFVCGNPAFKQPDFNNFRQNFNKNNRQHKSCAERENVFERFFISFMNSGRKENQTSQNICQSRK